MVRIVWIAFMCAILPGAAYAGIVVAEDAYVRLPPPVADTAAGYVTLYNHSDKDAVLVGASSPAAESTEFHGMTMKEGMMHMQQMKKTTIPAHGRIEFSQGGNHIMLIGLKQELEAGQKVPITAKLSDGSTLTFEAEVKDMRGSKADHGHGNHSEGMDVHGHHDMEHGHH